MAANDVILTRTVLPTHECSVKNTDGANDLVPGNTVKLDGANLISTTQPEIGVVRAIAGDKVFGIVLENIPKGKRGRVACPYAQLVPAIASGVVTAGDSVEADAAGKVKTTAGAAFVIGDALTTTAADGDQILLGIPAQAKV